MFESTIPCTTGDEVMALLTRLRTPAVSHVKRFMEQWSADPQFREELKTIPAQAAKRRGLPIDPDDIRLFWDESFRRDFEQAKKQKNAPAEPSLTREYLNFRKAKLDYADKIRKESVPLDPRFAAWRDRQMARVRTEFDTELYEAVVHPVFAVELSKGCSGGCSFCGLGATKLETYFPYTRENAVLWKETLRVLRRFTGVKAGRWGFLYWATEPFDNPDYEKFCSDFSDVFSLFPHTTTVLSLKDPPRTSRFIKLAEGNGCFHNRFSILSLGTLNAVHKSFTAEELCLVEMVLHNKGSVLKRFQVGRAREQARKQAQKKNQRFEEVPGQTIACVSGFLINMVKQSVQLISPCSASSRWPLGYWVICRGGFTDARDLAALLEKMIARYMPLNVPFTKTLRFRRDVNCELLPDGFQLSTSFGRHTFNRNSFFRELAEMIRQGDKSARELSRYFREEYIINPSISLGWLNNLFKNGVLDEEPPLPIGGC